MIESDINEFKNNLIGLEFIDILRIGKYLIFDLDKYYLISHLRMEGKYYIKNHDEEINKHEHIIFTFEDNIDLRYHDTRKFGRMCLINKDQLYEYNGIKKQGIEPISNDLNSSYLMDKFKNKNTAIKTLLLDQTIISGLGNIYADEVLFKSKINPNKKGNEITEKECINIINASKEIINNAILNGGTTIRSYTSSLGVIGKYQNYLMVHQRENQLCKICNSTIIKTKINGRGTYYCPKCQK